MRLKAALNPLCAIAAATILLAGVFPVPAATVTIDPVRQAQFADSLMKNGQYRRAAEEYQRFTFFFQGHPDRRTMQLNAGKAFLLANDPRMALTQLRPLTTTTPLDPIAVESFFLSAQCHLQLQAYTHAVVQLTNLVALTGDPQVADRAHYRIAWIHIDRMDWTGAQNALSRISNAGILRYDVENLVQALSEAPDMEQKSPTTAGMLSIIPGGGQLYCQRPKDALVAFILSVGTIWAAVEAFDNDQEALGTLLGVVGAGFYAGNIYGAVNSAHKFNAVRRHRFIHNLKQHARRSAMIIPYRNGIVVGLRIPF